MSLSDKLLYNFDSNLDRCNNKNEQNEQNEPNKKNKSNEPNNIPSIVTKKQKYKNVKITENINGKAIKIGQGGFGKVYKVIKKEDNNKLNNIIPFAQKHTYVFERDGNIIGQNLKEISIGYKYMNKHENLQKFQSIILDEKDYYNSKYIINMLLADMSFYDLINLNISKETKIMLFFPILKQLIKGLSYIHSNFISHGDIKPENILIYGDKKLLNNIQEYLKSATFQISDYSGINLEYNNTMDNTSTLYYRSPELFSQIDEKYKKTLKETYGPYNDIWSLAITMLEFLIQSNIISKLYKQSMKIKEKEFLSRFFHCVKSLDVSIVLKKNGYDVNNNLVKNIINVLELMLTKKINERINIYNLSIFINHYISKDEHFYINNNFNNNIFENIPLMNNVTEHIYDIKKEYINIELRKKSIIKLYDFLKEYNINNNKDYLPLSILLFDRFLSKNILKDYFNSSQYMYDKTLLECYYISSRYLLSDIDIMLITEFLNIDIDIIHMDILDILKQMDYDIYRPTILTFLNNQNDDIFHSKYIINNAIDYFCDINDIKTNYSASIEYICNYVNNMRNMNIHQDKLLEEISKDNNNYINGYNNTNLHIDNIDNIDNIDFTGCNKLILKRDEYNSN